MTREEAIKVVRNIYQTDAEKEALESLIPELKESEDERIIKTLQEYVKTRNWKANVKIFIMMNERARRNVARKFLEENFGKQGKHHLPINVITEISNMENGWKVLEAMFSITHNFELNKSWESMDADGKEAKAFEVIYAPYVSDADKQFIAVSDSKEELNEIVERVFPEDRIKHGSIEYERYGKYYIAYD